MRFSWYEWEIVIIVFEGRDVIELGESLDISGTY